MTIPSNITSVAGGGAAASPSPLNSPSRDDSATRIQTAYRRHRVQNHVITPGRIIEFLQSSYALAVTIDHQAASIVALDVYGIAILLCRKVMKLLRAKKNWGTIVKVDSLKGYLGWYYRESQEYRSKDPYHLAFTVDLRAEIFPNGKKVNLHFKPSDSQILGQGTYKTAFQAEDTVVTLNPTKHNQGWSRITGGDYTVRKVPRNPPAAGQQTQREQRLARGAQLHRDCYEALLAAKRRGEAQGVYLSDPEIDVGNNETRQHFYEQNLSLARRSGTPPALLMQYVLDAARTFEWLNSLGITHRDGLAANINISTDEYGQPIACLGDFDFAKRGFGVDPLAFKDEAYCMWDPCAAYGNFATPYLDLYSTSLLLCYFLIPELSLRDPPIAVLDPNDLRAKMAAMCDANFLRFNAIYLVGNNWTFDPNYCLEWYRTRHPQQTLNENQQKALIAFCRISYESAMLLKQCNNLFLNRSGFNFPNDVGHEEILEAIRSLRETELFPGSGHPTYTFRELITLITEIQQSCMRFCYLG